MNICIRNDNLKKLLLFSSYFQNGFGDVYMAEEFEPPTTEVIAAFSRRSHGVSSGPLQILDAKTIVIPHFTYNGAGKGIQCFFFCYVKMFLDQ